MTAVLLAQENSGVLVRSFVIALILVAPIAAWQWRRIRARRLAATSGNRRGGAAGATGTGGAQPDAEAAGGRPDPHALETIVASIKDLAASTASGEYAELDLSPGATLDGRPAAGVVVAAIVQDALERGGFEVLARRGNPEDGSGLCFECRRL